MARLSGPAIRRLMLFALPCVLGAGCDLGTKTWAVEALSDLPGQTMNLIVPWLDLSLSYNEGTAFSFVSDLGILRPILGGLSLLLVIALAFMTLRGRADGAVALSLGAVAAGAIGNGADRLFRELPGRGTAVVDFIRVNYPWGGSWPTFNVADVLVAVGAIGMLLATMRKPPPQGETPVKVTS